MITFIRSLFIFISRSFHYSVLNRGLGDFAPEAVVLPLNAKLPQSLPTPAPTRAAH